MKQLNWYQIFGNTHTIPDGRTVEPTDDIQIWLNCANIWDKSYTTLAEVLADTDTLLALISSNNAVDYMVRSTTWAIATALVPTMTSDTTPEGECFARDYENAGTGIYKAFDNNLVDSHWYSKWQVDPAGNYIGYHFTERVVVNRAIYDTTDLTSTAYCPHNVKVQGSNDNSTWTDLASDSWTQAYGRHVVEFINTTAYEYYRFYIVDGYSSKQVGATEVQFYSTSITDSADAMTYIGQNNYCANTLLADSTWCNAICNSEYFESVLNVKVPTMTSATTPEGEAFASSFYTATCEGWRAFNGNTSYAWTSGAADSTPYVGYMFTTTPHVHKVTMTVKYRTYSYANDLSAVAQYYDGENWNDIETLSLPSESTSTEVVKNLSYILSNTSEGGGFRLKFNHSTRPAGTNYFSCDILQFYGRKDI